MEHLERPSLSENKIYYQKILREFEKDPLLIVDDVVEESGSKIGDNYMSVIVRTYVTGKRGDDSDYRETLIAKYCPHHRPIAKITRNAELFQNEAHAYKQLLPRLKDVAAQCIYAHDNEIILQDLREHGYVVQPRKELLNIEHSILVIKKLAWMHAQSLALKFHEPEIFTNLLTPLVETVFPQDDRPTMGTTIESSLNTAILHISSLEDPLNKIESAVDFLKLHQGQSFNILRDLVVPGRGKFDVIAHGDVWNNNILFKHNAEGRPIDLKFIDFQMVRHISAATDFHYFIYSSVKSSVIEQHYDHLVETYQKSLQEYLRKLNVSEDIVDELSLQWFKAQLKEYANYGLYTSCWLVHAVLAHDEDTINMDDLTEEFMQEMQKFQPPIRREKAERIFYVTQHFMRTFA